MGETGECSGNAPDGAGLLGKLKHGGPGKPPERFGGFRVVLRKPGKVCLGRRPEESLGGLGSWEAGVTKGEVRYSLPEG